MNISPTCAKFPQLFILNSTIANFIARLICRISPVAHSTVSATSVQISTLWSAGVESKRVESWSAVAEPSVVSQGLVLVFRGIKALAQSHTYDRVFESVHSLAPCPHLFILATVE